MGGAGYSFQGSSEATATGRNELTSGHIFNFGDGSGVGMSPWMIGGMVAMMGLMLYMVKK